MNTIATLYQLQQHLGLSSGDDDARLLDALQAASAQMERLAGRRFCPHAATLAHTIDPKDPASLLLNDDLLSLTSLTCNDGSSISTSDALLIPGSGQPASIILLVGGSAFTWADTPQQAVNVAGTWGWHDDWANAWRGSNDVVKDAALGASNTTITVADAQGVDAEAESPRFQVGQLLKIGDEYLRITAITINAGSDDALAVRRGVNGTTAVAHNQNTVIYTYQPPEDVNRLCLRWATWVYREPDGHFPDDFPPALLAELAGLRRVGVKG